MNIFLSYSHSDKPIVEIFAERLRKFGHEVFVDTQSIQLGASLSAALSEQLNAADAVVFFVSKSALQSDWFNKELGIAVSNRYSERQTRIIPVLLDKDAQIPFFLNDYLFIDLTSPDSEKEINEQIDRLATSLKKGELKGVPEAELAQRLREIELEHEFLKAKKIHYYEIKKHESRQLFFLTTIAAMFSITGVIIFSLNTFIGVRLEDFGWLVSALFGAVSTMLGSYFYMRKDKPEKRKVELLLTDLERRIGKMEARDE